MSLGHHSNRASAGTSDAVRRLAVDLEDLLPSEIESAGTSDAVRRLAATVNMPKPIKLLSAGTSDAVRRLAVVHKHL